jgi:hypothetical protein
MYDSLAVSVKRLTEGDMRLQEATTKVLEQYEGPCLRQNADRRNK